MPSVPASVSVKTINLDTDEELIERFEVEMPPEAPAQQRQLADLVGRLHPDAPMRSFGSGAASFLGPRRLIVAHYDRDASAGRGSSRGAGDRSAAQHSLFSA